MIEQPNSTEYAYAAGVEYAKQLASEHAMPRNFTPNDDLPDGDYSDMVRLFGSVTLEMEHAYKTGFNQTNS